MQRFYSVKTALSQRFSKSWMDRRIMPMAALGFCLVLLLGTFTPALAQPLPGRIARSPQEVINPRQANGAWVSDMADLLSPADETELNQLISAHEAESGDEIAIVTVADTASATTPKAFATELFNEWEIGKASEDNGLLFLISKGDRRVEIEVGYGLEGLLPDASVSQIIWTQVTPQFKQGNFDKGILEGTESLIAMLNGEGLTPTATQPTADFWSFFGLIAMLVLSVGGFTLFIRDLGSSEKSRRNRRRSRNRRGGSSNRSHAGSASNIMSGHCGGSSGGGYSGGGSFGGGSSGGGGAGGSW